MKTALLFLTGLVCMVQADTQMDLSGTWRFAQDKQDQGIEQKWFAADLKADKVSLPGSCQSQGYGDKPGPDTPWTGDIQKAEWNKARYAPYRNADNFKMPFWLQPDEYYKGPTWYQRTISIPKSWKDKRITLTLERPHWETRVWVDSQAAGSANYLSAPHVYDLSRDLTPGKHTLTIRVDNREVVHVGVNSHSISDHTQSNWNGIVGKIQLKAESPVWIDDVQVYPDLQKKSVRVRIQLGSQAGTNVSGQLTLIVSYGGQTVRSSTVPFTADSAESTIALGDNILAWDEFNPNLYELKTQLASGFGSDEHKTVFGMREVTTRENRILLNGHPVFMRGTL